jgi:uncharacterized membrane-anchored protein YjiN (DUF445 family)
VFDSYGSGSHGYDRVKEIVTQNLSQIVDPAKVVALTKEQVSGEKLQKLVESYFGYNGEGKALVFQRIKEILPDISELIDPAKVVEYAKTKLSSDHFLQDLVDSFLRENKERLSSQIEALLPDFTDLIDLENVRKTAKQIIADRFTYFSVSDHLRKGEPAKLLKEHADRIFAELIPAVSELINTEQLMEELKKDVIRQINWAAGDFVYGPGKQLIRDQVMKILGPELKRQLTPERVRESIEKQLPHALEAAASTMLKRSGQPGYEAILQTLSPIISQIATEVVTGMIEEDNSSNED